MIMQILNINYPDKNQNSRSDIMPEADPPLAGNRPLQRNDSLLNEERGKKNDKFR